MECESNFGTEYIYLGWGDTSTFLMRTIGDFFPPSFTSPSHIFQIILLYIEMLNTLSSASVAAYRLPWKKIFPAMIVAFNSTDPYRTCRITRGTGILVNGTWAVRAIVTNLTASDSVHERGILVEDMTLKDGRIHQLDALPDDCAENKHTQEQGMVIATKEKLSWREGISLPNEEAPSSIVALRRGSVEKIKVQEADSRPILALLVLQAVLSLLPLAVFQEATLSATLTYDMVTDVLSVLPLAVKGIELAMYGSTKHYAHVSYVWEVQTEVRWPKVHTWVTECETKGYIWRRGVAMMAVAAALMLFGIFLEVMSKRIVSRKVDVKSWSGFAVLQEDGDFIRLRMP